MAKKRDDDRLIFLLPEDVSRQLDHIFEQFSKDEELRNRFVGNPVGVLKDLGVDLPPDVDVSLTNRIVFHLMGNEAYITWVHDYIEKLRSRYGNTIPLDMETGEAIAKDIERAMREHLSPELKNEYEEMGGMPACSIVLLFVAFVGIVVVVSVNILLALNFATGVNAVFQVNFWTDTHFSAFGAGISGGRAWGGPDG